MNLKKIVDICNQNNLEDDTHTHAHTHTHTHTHLESELQEIKAFVIVFLHS